MKLGVTDQHHFIWQFLNSALADQSAREFYGMKPYTVGDRRLKIHEEIEAVAEELPGPMLPLACELYQRYGAPMPLHRFLGEHAHDYCIYTAPGGVMVELFESRQLDFVLKSLNLPKYPRALMLIQEFVTWYSWERPSLEVVNWGAFPFTPLANITKLFDSFTEFAVTAGTWAPNIYTRATPVWWAYSRFLKEKYGVTLNPSPIEVASAKAVAAKAPLEYEHVERPTDYWKWGFKQRYLWDFENSREFRENIFKQDKELEDAWEAVGHDIDALHDWMRGRDGHT